MNNEEEMEKGKPKEQENESKSVLPTKEENERAIDQVTSILQAFASSFEKHKGGDLNE